MNDPHDNERDDKAVLERLRRERTPDRAAHEATWAPEGDGYLVTCPHGCKLGTSAHQDTEDGARRRVEMHSLATAPLTSEVRSL